MLLEILFFYFPFLIYLFFFSLYKKILNSHLEICPMRLQEKKNLLVIKSRSPWRQLYWAMVIKVSEIAYKNTYIWSCSFTPTYLPIYGRWFVFLIYCSWYTIFFLPCSIRIRQYTHRHIYTNRNTHTHIYSLS